MHSGSNEHKISMAARYRRRSFSLLGEVARRELAANESIAVRREVGASADQVGTELPEGQECGRDRNTDRTETAQEMVRMKKLIIALLLLSGCASSTSRQESAPRQALPKAVG